MAEHLRLVNPVLGPEQKTLPHSEENEQCILGAVLLDDALFAEVAVVVRAEHFYFERHRKIWESFERLAAAKKPLDLRTVQADMEAAGTFEASGGIAYLAFLDTMLPDIGRVLVYAEIVVERAARRKLIAAANEAIRGALDGSCRLAEDVLAEAVASHREVGDMLDSTSAKPGFTHVAKGLGEVGTPEAIGQGVTCGIPGVDRKMIRFLFRHFYGIGGRPSEGKTAKGLQLAVQIADRQRHAVGIVSLEMPKIELQTRLVSHVGRIDYERLQTGQLSAVERAVMEEAKDQIAAMPIYIDDSPGLTTPEICRRVRKLYETKGCRAVILDYLGLVRLPNSDKRHDILVGDVAMAIDNLAKELGFVGIALIQLNRKSAVEKRKPQMSDLRDSGILEQVCQGVLFVHRDKSDTDAGEMLKSGSIIVGKARNGTTGEVRCNFLGEYQTWVELDQGHTAEEPWRRL